MDRVQEATLVQGSNEDRRVVEATPDRGKDRRVVEATPDRAISRDRSHKMYI
jgi:hypothetical protein